MDCTTLFLLLESSKISFLTSYEGKFLPQSKEPSGCVDEMIVEELVKLRSDVQVTQ